MRMIDHLRGAIYDRAIAPMTATWYRAVLERLPVHCRLLDVGVGTGSALLANADVLRARDLRVTGVDVDAAYLRRCRRRVERRGLDDRIEARLESVYDHQGGPYDAVYFSASFMLLPDPSGALRHVGSLLRPGGSLFFTQTFERRVSRTVEILKPLLRFLTTIDFGRVTYESDFRRALSLGGFAVESLQSLGEGRGRSFVLVKAAPGRRNGA